MKKLKYKITILGVDFSECKHELHTYLTPAALLVAKRIIKHGGSVEFGLGSINENHISDEKAT